MHSTLGDRPNPDVGRKAADPVLTIMALALKPAKRTSNKLGSQST
jgi:hypothetical protein